jgi:predicted enzyme related to lactoylglutathione lyase
VTGSTGAFGRALNAVDPASELWMYRSAITTWESMTFLLVRLYRYSTSLVFTGQEVFRSGTILEGMATDSRPVRQLRLVVEAVDFDEVVHFYRDVLGLAEEAAFEAPDDARVVILDAGRATLELVNPAQKRMIDDVEVGRPVSRAVRVAFEVNDAAATTDALVDAGAILIAPPVETPWRSLNARLEAPAGLQITVFQELETPGQRTEGPGFGTSATR